MIIIHWFYIVPFLVPKDAMDETKTEYGKQKDKKAQKSTKKYALSPKGEVLGLGDGGGKVSKNQKFESTLGKIDLGSDK